MAALWIKKFAPQLFFFFEDTTVGCTILALCEIKGRCGAKPCIFHVHTQSYLGRYLGLPGEMPIDGRETRDMQRCRICRLVIAWTSRGVRKLK